MKPVIFKRDGIWYIRFMYDFSKYKLRTPQQRKQIGVNHVQEAHTSGWQDAVDYLAELYRRREVIRDPLNRRSYDAIGV